MSVLKANRYRIVDNSAFEMPLPLKFTVWKSDSPVCEYVVSEEEQVSYKILTRYKELMITSIHRPLSVSDVYYLFSCRVFQDRTPYTYPILERMGLEKYNILNILKRTHGITPYDDYWLFFDGEKLTYDKAKEDYEECLIAPESQPVPIVSYPAGGISADAVGGNIAPADVNSILNQQKLNVSDIIAENSNPTYIAPETSYEPEHTLENNKMSEAEIESLLRSCGITDSDIDSSDSSDDAAETDNEPSGGKMSQEDIERMLAAAQAPVEPEPAPASGGKMSQEDIEKMLAASAQPEPMSAETKSEEDSGGKMSQEDIEKMLAAAQAPAEPEPAPAPAPAPAPSSGGKMSQEDIEKMLAAAQAPSEPAEPEPAPEPAPAPSSGGKMSQEDIEKMLAAAQAPSEPAEPEPAPEPAPAPASGGKMSQEDIEKMLAAAQVPSEPAEPEPTPAPAPAPSSGGKMSQEDIEKMLAAAQAPSEPAEPEPAPEPAPAPSSGGKMSQEDIEKMLAAAQAPSEPEPAPEPASAPAPASGGKMSQNDIEALLNSMKEEAAK